MSDNPRIARIRASHPIEPVAESGQEPLLLDSEVAVDEAGSDLTQQDAIPAEDEYIEAYPTPARSKTPVYAVAGLAAVAWTAFFAWANWSTIAGASAPNDWTGLIASWSMPIAVICALTLLLNRSGQGPADRFGTQGELLNRQVEHLESKLSRINGELSVAREFLTNQTRELEFLGRGAADRITDHSERLQALITENSVRLEAIEAVSATARDNMNALRGDLPVLSNATRDLTNQIGGANEQAHQQMDRLTSAFDRVTQAGKDGEERLSHFHRRLDILMRSLEERGVAMSDTQNEQLDALQERVEGLSNRIAATHDAHSRGAEESLRALETDLTRIEELLNHRDRNFSDGLAERRTAIAAFEEETLAGLSDRMAELDHTIATRREQEIAQTLMLTEHAEAVGSRLAELGERLDTITAGAQAARSALGSQAGALEERLEGVRALTAETGNALNALTDSSVRLLELIRSGAKHSTDELPASMAAAEDKLSRMSEQGENLRRLMFETGDKSDALIEHLIDASNRGEAAAAKIDEAGTLLAANDERHRAATDSIVASLDELQTRSAELADTVEGRLDSAVGRARSNLSAAIAEIERLTDEGAVDLAAAVRERTASEVVDAIREQGGTAIAEMLASAQAANAQGRESVVYLREQLGRIHELTANLESRIAQARERSEEQINGDFARRAALLIESLNSAAIDVDKMLSNDVSDTAWSQYLRGDRGIFARRAVRLLDAKEAREIASLYEDDAEFREYVSRYIHDFESMLRMLLATANGHSLSVTLLGSDMGKMYVALAQAIERLRD